MEARLYQRGYDDDIIALRQRLAETTLLLEVLAQVNSLVSHIKSFEDFCVRVTKILQEKFGVKYIHIWIRDEVDPEKLQLVTPENAGAFRTLTIQDGVVGKTIRENRTVCLADVREEPSYISVHPEAKSELCVPLRHDGKAIGVLNIETDTPQNFTATQPIIELIAENLGHSMKLALLYKTEEYFHRLVEQMNEGVWVGDENERTLYTNPTLQRMTGFTEGELREKSSYDYFDEEGKKILGRENMNRKRGEFGHYEAHLIAKSGERVPVIIHAVPFGKGGSLATLADMRDLKATEQKLVRAEQFLASITQYCAEAIVGLDTEGIIQSWNVGAEKMFGFKDTEALGKSMGLIIPEERRESGELSQILHDTVSRGSLRNFETVRIHKNGKPISVSLTTSSVRGQDREIMGISAIHRDITAQKKWERELQDRFEKMQDAYKEMGKQRRYLDYLMDIINLAAETKQSPKQIAAFVVNAMVMISRVDAVTLRLLDPSTQKLTLTAHTGVSEEWISKKSIPYAGSLAEKAFRKGHPIKILDIVSDPMYPSQALARKNNLRSALIIPLIAKTDFLGSLTLYLSQEGNLSLLDDEFIIVFGKQAAIALKLAL